MSKGRALTLLTVLFNALQCRQQSHQLVRMSAVPTKLKSCMPIHEIGTQSMPMPGYTSVTIDLTRSMYTSTQHGQWVNIECCGIRLAMSVALCAVAAVLLQLVPLLLAQLLGLLLALLLS